jgi:hypothetical protein
VPHVIPLQPELLGNNHYPLTIITRQKTRGKKTVAKAIIPRTKGRIPRIQLAQRNRRITQKTRKITQKTRRITQKTQRISALIARKMIRGTVKRKLIALQTVWR